MADTTLKDAIETMQKTLSTLATKSDLQSLKSEIGKVRDDIESFCKKTDDRVSKVFDIEQKFDQLANENTRLREQKEKLKDRLVQAESDLNDLEQYGRRQNIKIYNLKELENESAKDTTRRACKVLTDILKVETKPENIEACHRIPASTAPTKDGKSRIKPIIVRFKDRSHRDEILKNKSKCKGQEFSVSEDLTRANGALCKAAFDHPNCKASWSSNGKVKARLKELEFQLVLT